uniref:Myosin_tail_1 domain-containing protein n=1 Tax=Ascaris lumbricoides TaxID=6252 RepID=A0A0M3INZ1_ASCLU
TSTPRSVDRHSNIVVDSFQPDLSEVHGRVLDDPFPDIAMEDAQGDYTALDWAMEVVSKQEELKRLSKEHDRTRQEVNSMQSIIAELQQRVGCAEETIKDLNSERNTLLKKLERYKKSAEDNEMILARCKEELVTAQKKIAELENISLEVDVDKDAECNTITKLLEEKEQANMMINQIRQEAEEREKELLREKEALLSSANEERRHLAEWREKATRLDQLVIKQNAELIRYAEIEKRYTDILKELDEERAKVSELSRELQLQNDDAKKYRDEVMHLRVKLDEMKLALASATKDSTPTKEMTRLRDECERLQIQLEADREIKVCVSFPSTKHSLSRWK